MREPTTAADIAQVEYEKPSSNPPAPAMETKLKAPSSRPLIQARNNSMNGPLYMQTVNNKIIVGRPKRKGDGTLKDLARWLFENQTGFSFNLIALLFMTHFCMPKARPYTSKFFTLSYFNPNTGKYAAGFDDVYFMTFCIILLTGLRAGSMEHIFAPLGKVWGIAKRKDATRFSEQAWLFIYSGILWPLGLYIYYNSAYFLNMAELWTNWPDRELHALMKGYMLLQWAWWIQQVLVIHLESRRKDHWQMLTHHFVTIALISSAYYYHQTRVGNLILILMDVVDLFLPLAKCLKYLGFTTLCDYVFGLFMISWFIPRHIFFLQTCWSIYSDLPKALAGDCYKGIMDKLEGPFPKPAGWSHVLEPFTNPEGTVCFDDTIRYSFLFFLLALQVIILMWFVVIIRVATKVLKGGSAEDVRSDDEDEEEEEELEYEQVQQPAQPVKEEVGVEDLDLKGWERRAGVKRNTASTTSTTGVSLPGHSARKELLNRIGCEKQID